MAEKLEMMSSDIIKENIDYIAKKFPNALKEVIEDGKVVKKIDFDVLKQELSTVVIDDRQERYQMTWPDKKQSILSANSRINETLRPIKEKSFDFENTKNIYIEGDNLHAVKLLRETYLNKIDLIYLDPPYNTGRDLIYKNSYEVDKEAFKLLNNEIDEKGYIIINNADSCGRFHTDWINMMYSRIKVSYDLLSNNGCLVISIDHNEVINVTKILDEIFGERNRVGIVTVVHKPEGRNQEKYFATSNEFAIFYAKNIDEFLFQPALLDEDIEKTYDREDSKGKYKLNPLMRIKDGTHIKNINIENFNYPIYVDKDLNISLEEEIGFTPVYPISKTGRQFRWRVVKESLKELIKNGEIVAEINKGEIEISQKYRITKGQLIKTHWIDKKYNATVNGTKVLENLMGFKAFDFPKSLYFMIDILKLTTKKDSIVLDMFSGSATTAQAVMKLNSEDNGNRKFIMVQLPDEIDKKTEAYENGFKNICEIGQERIRKAGYEIEKLIESLGKNIDKGFRVLQIDSSNMNDVYYNPNEIKQELLEQLVGNVKEDRTPLDLLFQVMLELGIELSAKIEEKELLGKKYFVVNENDIVACFDDGISDSLVTELAKIKPIYAVFKDSSFESDSANINSEQIFRTISPSTRIRVI